MDEMSIDERLERAGEAMKRCKQAYSEATSLLLFEDKSRPITRKMLIEEVIELRRALAETEAERNEFEWYVSILIDTYPDAKQAIEDARRNLKRKAPQEQAEAILREIREGG